MVDKILIAVTGASGALYAEKLILELLPRVSRVYVVFSATGATVVPYELPNSSPINLILKNQYKGEHTERLRVFKNDDFYAPVASGSSVPDAMIINPCSMGTLARVRCGVSQTLIERAADVTLKEGRNLIVCPRESPLSVIHLENMLALARMGVKIIPLAPPFYQHPKTLQDLIDFMTGKILEALGLKHELYQQWNERRC
jgi:4-hydroxy-3-polyprenylbenzoate decarboxylase